MEREKKQGRGSNRGVRNSRVTGKKNLRATSVQQARKAARTGRWRVSGGMSLRGKKKELDRSTDAFDCIEDQKFGGKVVHTYMES